MPEAFKGDHRDHETQKPINLTELENNFDLSEEDFEEGEGWRLKAKEYSTIIWALALAFSENKCEATHFNFTTSDDGDPTDLFYCITFFENTFEDFMIFIKKHEHLIPDELREKFRVVIGFNYGDAGGVQIESKTTNLLTQDEVETVYSSPLGIVGTGRQQIKDKTNINKLEALEDNLHQTVSDALK